MTVNDKMMRPIVENYLRNNYGGATRILHEVALAAVRGRVDLLQLYPSALHGYELKSDVDKLDRLTSEILSYVQVLDYLTIVVTEKHVSETLAIVHKLEEKCGVLMLRKDSTLVNLMDAKHLETRQDPGAMAQLLWRETATRLLTSQGIPFKKSCNKVCLHTLIKDHVPKESVRTAVALQYFTSGKAS